MLTSEYLSASQNYSRCGDTLIICEYWSCSWYALDENAALGGAVRKTGQDELCFGRNLSSRGTLGLLGDRNELFSEAETAISRTWSDLKKLDLPNPKWRFRKDRHWCDWLMSL